MLTYFENNIPIESYHSCCWTPRKRNEPVGFQGQPEIELQSYEWTRVNSKNICWQKDWYSYPRRIDIQFAVISVWIPCRDCTTFEGSHEVKWNVLAVLPFVNIQCSEKILQMHVVLTNPEALVLSTHLPCASYFRSGRIKHVVHTHTIEIRDRKSVV